MQTCDPTSEAAPLKFRKVHQCLKKTSRDGVGAPPDAPASDDGGSSPISATGAGDERVAVAVNGGALRERRVLVLEDDPAFCGIIRDYLAESGYSVVAVGSGGEGVREVLASDFAMVLCDFMMPGLPGDMFYRAVERIRPALCKGFIFMTGHQNDARTNQFIQSVHAFALRKPFPLSHLLDSLALAEVRRTYHSVIERRPGEPELWQPPQPADALPFGVTRPGNEAETAKMAAPACRLPLPASDPPLYPGVQAADRTAAILPASNSKPRPNGMPRRNALFWSLGFLLFLVIGFWNRYSDAQDRVTTAAADRLARQAEWATVSRTLEKAGSQRAKIEKERTQSARILADRAKPRLSFVLRCIVPSAGEKIDIIEVSARCETEESGIEEVRIQGVAHGPEPRSIADRYRQSAERKLNGNTGRRPVTARFELLEDLPRASAEQDRAKFAVVISPVSAEPLSAEKEEGR